MFALGAACLGD